MKQTNLSLLQFASFLLVLFMVVSCDKKQVEVERTFETELEELDELLRDYEANGHEVDTTDLGVFYVKLEEGEGPYPQGGDTVFFRYYAFHPDGTLFDSESEYANRVWRFIYLHQKLSVGLNDGIAHMNKGTYMDIIIPSHLAYGSEGTKQVPPFTSVIYRARMHDIKFQENE